MINMSQQLLHFLEFLLHNIVALKIFSVRIKLLVLESGKREVGCFSNYADVGTISNSAHGL